MEAGVESVVAPMIRHIFSNFHEKLNARLKEIIHNAFCFKNGRQYCKFIVLSSEITHFVKHESKAKTGNRENIPESSLSIAYLSSS